MQSHTKLYLLASSIARSVDDFIKLDGSLRQNKEQRKQSHASVLSNMYSVFVWKLSTKKRYLQVRYEQLFATFDRPNDLVNDCVVDENTANIWHTRVVHLTAVRGDSISQRCDSVPSFDANGIFVSITKTMRCGTWIESDDMQMVKCQVP